MGSDAFTNRKTIRRRIVRGEDSIRGGSICGSYLWDALRVKGAWLSNCLPTSFR